MKYSEEEESFIKDSVSTMSNKEISEVLGKSRCAIESKVRNLGLKRKEVHIFTEEEILFIKDNFDSMSKKELAESLGLSYNVIEHKTRQLELRHYVYKTWTEEDIAFLTYNFPIHKGKYCSEKLNRSFHAVHKKAEELGLEINWKYKYVGGGYEHDCTIRSKRVRVHRALMEEYLGRKLTSNEVVHHKDGNKLNNILDNLEVMTRSEHIDHHREELIQGQLAYLKLSQDIV